MLGEIDILSFAKEFRILDFTRIVNYGIVAYAIVAEAKNDKALAFYEYFGFIPLSSSPMALFMPMQSFERQWKQN